MELFNEELVPVQQYNLDHQHQKVQITHYHHLQISTTFNWYKYMYFSFNYSGVFALKAQGLRLNESNVGGAMLGEKLFLLRQIA